LENNVDDLYAIAHKYEVHSLMDKCEIIMASSIGKINKIPRVRTPLRFFCVYI